LERVTQILAVAIAITAFGGFISAGFARDIYFALKSKRWPRTDGRVIEWGLHWGGNISGIEDDSAVVGYEYQVGGVRYTSRRLDYAGRGAGWSAWRVLGRYPEGDVVSVIYDPSEPARAVLQPGMSIGNVLRLLVGLAILGLGLLFLTGS
jgi:hypothetical protein